MSPIYIVFSAELDPSQGQAYPARAAASIATTRTALEGTLLYDVFQSADGSRATIVEAYDSNDALLRHMAALGKAAAPPLEARSTGITLLGDLGEDLKAKFAERGARYFGPRRFGLVERWQDGQVPTTSQSVILTATFRRAKDGWDEFWRIAREAYDSVRDGEPDTLAYEWFFSDDGQEALVLDIYRDVPSLLVHAANVEARMAALAGMVEEVNVEFFGGLPADLATELTSVEGRSFLGQRLGGLV